MENNPLVSVIIATYNRVGYLKLTIESVVNQTYNNIEVIVVDDGSLNNDASDLCKIYNNISYFKTHNSGGPASPRNCGLRQAKGKYVAFLDDDDLWLPYKIEQQVKILETNPTFGLVHGPCKVIDKNGKPSGEIIGRPGSTSVKHGNVKLKMMGNWTLMMPTPLIAISVLKKVGNFNTNIPSALEDVEFWTRCSFYTNFYYLDQPLALYRVHDSNISAFNKNYVHLPLYLKKVLENQYKKAYLTNSQYKKLLCNLCFSQAKKIQMSPFHTIFNLFRLNPFWIINFRIYKVIIKRILA